MPWIRLSDNYIDHPKFLALTATAFRLWHEGMAYCRKHQTDGVITLGALQGFRYYRPVRATELATPYKPGVVPLWETIEGGFKVHDYLEWNPSKEDEVKRSTASKERSKHYRAPPSERGSPPHTNSVRTPFEPVRSGSEKLLEKSSADDLKTELDARAGQLLELYQELFVKFRRGARYHARPHLDFPKACELVRTWTDDDRLSKMIQIVLTTDDDWIAGTDRGFAVFVAKATWADDRLREWEAKNGVTV